MKKEIWKKIFFIKNNILYDFSDRYEVSNYGKIRNIKTKRILKSGTISGGYMGVVLSKNGKTTSFSVHRIVATMFIENPNNLPCVNHKDENRKNNQVENLEWCTYEYNNNYGSHKDKLSIIQRNDKKKSREIIGINLKTRTILSFPSTMEAERVLGFNNSNINKCCMWHNNPIEYSKKYKKIHKTCGKDEYGNPYTWYYKEDYLKIKTIE